MKNFGRIQAKNEAKKGKYDKIRTIFEMINFEAENFLPFFFNKYLK